MSENTDLRHHRCNHDERYDLVDAAGIFCCYVCPLCEETKKASYNSYIFRSGTVYSRTGSEEDL